MAHNECFRFAVIGKEGAGKSQLISSLTGRDAGGSSTGGSAASEESRGRGRFAFVDTPGIAFGSDGETAEAAIPPAREDGLILLVARATDMDDDLGYFLPRIRGRMGMVIVTNWDRVDPKNAARLEGLERDLGVHIAAVDARRISES